MAPPLAVGMLLVGAFLLASGVLAGFWLRGVANDPGQLQARATLRELLAERKARQRQVEGVSNAVALILRDPSVPPTIRLQLEGVQRRLVENATVE